MKKFNGRKLSHGANNGHRGVQRQCALCGSTMVRFRGLLRCTEIQKAKTGNNAFRVVKHGSLRTIAKRIKQRSVS